MLPAGELDLCFMVAIFAAIASGQPREEAFSPHDDDAASPQRANARTRASDRRMAYRKNKKGHITGRL